VDLDGTLLTVDTLYEQFASGLFAKPVKTIVTLTVLRHGIVAFKRQLCSIAHHAGRFARRTFDDKLPLVQTSIGGLQIADTCYYYPEDRGVAESIRLGRRMAENVSSDVR
jgi:hypothetical protein